MDGLFLRHLEFSNHIGNYPDKYLNVYQKYVGDVGCVVWDAALVLSHYLFTESGNKYIYKKHVLELGAGTGVVGLASILAGSASVILTDLPKHLSLMTQNIEQNVDVLCKCFPDESMVSKQVQAHVFQWGSQADYQQIFLDSSSSHIQCVLIADCIYYQEGMMKLLDTILMLMHDAQNDCNVLCCYETRDTPEKVEILTLFINKITSNPSLKLFSVPYSEMDKLYRSEDIHILIISKSLS